jgi:hypothetical protein
MESTAILIPSLGRPHRVRRLLDDVAAKTRCPATTYFVVEREDAKTIEAVRKAGARLIFNPGPPTYASCINAAYRETDEAYLFLGADDIVFADSWLEAALSAMEHPGVCVVGTADPVWPLPDHSTHSLVRRRYIEEQSGCLDLRDTVLYPYWHGFTDHEFVGVAKARGVYRYCQDSRVEHHHPGWDPLGRVRGGSALDSTYRKGNRHHRRDIVTFVERSEQWMPLIDAPSRIDLDMRRFVARNRGARGSIRYRLRRLTEAVSGASRRVMRALRGPS